MIKDIVFDFGGVLTTINTEQALQRFRHLGVNNPEEYINSYCQKGAFYELENGDIDAEEFCNRLSVICDREITFTQAKHAWLGFLADVHTYLLEYLQTLRSRYRLSVLSNTNPFIQSWAMTSEFTPCGRSLSDYFDNLFFSYRLHCSKPDVNIYRKMLENGEMNASETLFVDDSAKNIEAAERVGIKTLLVSNGEDWRTRLEEKLAAEHAL